MAKPKRKGGVPVKEFMHACNAGCVLDRHCELIRTNIAHAPTVARDADILLDKQGLGNCVGVDRVQDAPPPPTLTHSLNAGGKLVALASSQQFAFLMYFTLKPGVRLVSPPVTLREVPKGPVQ